MEYLLFFTTSLDPSLIIQRHLSPPFRHPKRPGWQTLVWRASSVKVSALALVLLISDSPAWKAYESHWWVHHLVSGFYGFQDFPRMISGTNVLWHFAKTDKGILKHRKNHIVSVSKQFDCMANGLPHSELMNEILAALSHLQYFDNPNWCRTLCMNSIKSSCFRNSKLIS